MSISLDLKTELPCSDLHAIELSKLRLENQRLLHELESARLRPLLDESSSRINVCHELWLRQQSDLRHLEVYKRRYYVAVFILLLVTAKIILSCH